jgi:hypothetical protein
MPGRGQGQGRVAARRQWVRDALLALIVVAVAVPAIVLVTRALAGAGDLKEVTGPASLGPVAIESPTGSPQTCASCWVDKGAPAPAVAGETMVLGGVQVLNVGLVDGYYRPNRFTVRAGVPVKVVFTGWAEDCLGHPEFPELELKGDLSRTGQAVFPLGPLEAGTYTFTCAMGVNEGRITVE